MNFDKANTSIIRPAEDQIDEVLDATAEDLQRFIRAGGSIDFDSWSQLNEFSKDCLVTAKYEWRVEFVYMIAKGVREKYGPEQIWAMLDGGESFKDKVAEDQADIAAFKAAESIEDESVPSGSTDKIQAQAGDLARNK